MTGVCELPFQAMLLSGTIETRTSCVFSLTCESTVPGCGHRLVARIFQFIILSPHPEVRIELTFCTAIVRGNPISLQHRVVSCSDACTRTTAQPWWRFKPVPNIVAPSTTRARTPWQQSDPCAGVYICSTAVVRAQ